jgi:hypothetical protein
VNCNSNCNWAAHTSLMAGYVELSDLEGRHSRRIIALERPQDGHGPLGSGLLVVAGAIAVMRRVT